MSRKPTKKQSGEGLDQDRTDWNRLDAMQDEDIDTSDIAALDVDFFRNAQVVVPPEKKHVSIRLDADVLEWMKSQGKGYQTRINAVLRAYYEAHRDRKH
jgi:uncharacterized protein (DUF4415 family)